MHLKLRASNVASLGLSRAGLMLTESCPTGHLSPSIRVNMHNTPSELVAQCGERSQFLTLHLRLAHIPVDAMRTLIRT